MRRGWMWRMPAAIALLALAAFTWRNISPPQLAAALARADARWLAIAIVAFAAILPLWAWQWQMLARASAVTDVRYRTMFEVVAITSSALNTTAFLIGEASAVAMLVLRTGLSQAQALSVLAVDQLLVGIAKCVVVSLALTQLVASGSMRNALLALSCGVVLLAATCVFVAARRSWGDRGFMQRLSVALAPVRAPGRLLNPLLVALAKKAVELVAIVCVQRAFGVTLPWGSAVVALAALNVATLLPLVPGNLGIYEATVVFAYSRFGLPARDALAIGLVQHACYFVALALPGYLSVVRAAGLRRVVAIR